MIINWNARLIRRSLAAIIVFVAIIVIVPSLFVEQSFNAIINARTISIHTPVEGTVSYFKKEVGDPVKAKEYVALIKNIRLNASFRRELEVEKNSLEDRVRGINQHLAELRGLRNQLNEKLQNTKSFENSRVDKQIQEQEYELAAQRNILAGLELLFAKQTYLTRSGSVSTTEYENTKHAVMASKNRISALESRIGALKIEKQALAKDVFLGEGRNDVPYTQQKIDELTVTISTVSNGKLEHERRIKEIQQQMFSEDDRLTLNRTAELISPVNGLIWKKMFPDGSEVTIGTEIAQVVDCGRLFLEVEVNENSLGKIEMGTEVKYRLRNTEKWLTGKIMGKSGSGRTLTDTSLAAELFLERTQAKIMVQVKPEELDPDPRNYCHIGRKVEVTMPRTWTTGIWITRFWGLFSWN